MGQRYLAFRNDSDPNGLRDPPLPADARPVSPLGLGLSTQRVAPGGKVFTGRIGGYSRTWIVNRLLYLRLELGVVGGGIAVGCDRRFHDAIALIEKFDEIQCFLRGSVGQFQRLC